MCRIVDPGTLGVHVEPSNTSSKTVGEESTPSFMSALNSAATTPSASNGSSMQSLVEMPKKSEAPLIQSVITSETSGNIAPTVVNPTSINSGATVITTSRLRKPTATTRPHVK